MELNKTITVINFQVANAMLRAGCVLKEIGINNRDSTRNVFHFEWSKEAKTLLELLTKK